MMRKITEIPATIFPKIQDKDAKLNVAAYCRVSTEKEEQENSLENQIYHYRREIEANPNWTLVDVFIDFGLSGLNDTKRTEFMRMIEMCNQGKIDLILTKSISRFARNQLDCLSYIRKLKSKNIGIRFDKEGINTLDPSSEIFLSWFSAFAQAESESLSMNVTRGKRMGYKEGKFAFPCNLYGYKKDENNNPEIIPQQASVVRKIFHLYLEGNSIDSINKWLKENEIQSPKGYNKWSNSTISGILKNEKYMGDALLQKTYTVDFLTKTTAKNKGEVNQYYIENNHEGIISKEIFNMVQDEIKRRANLYCGEQKSKHSSQYALTGKVFCGECGTVYRRVTWSRGGKKKIVWRCVERLTNGTKNCKNSPTISEDDLHNAILKSIREMVSDTDSIAETVKNEIEAVLSKDNDCNPQVIKRKIKNNEKETITLKTILSETEDKKFYINKIMKLEEEISVLNEKLQSVSERKSSNMMCQIEQFIDDTELNMNDYFNTLVRHLIESVVVISEHEINIKYIGRVELKMKL